MRTQYGLAVTLLSVAIGLAGAGRLQAQRVVPGWQEPVPGALLAVVYEERLSVDQIAAREPRLFERFPRPAPRYAVDVYRIVFWTSDADGSPVRVHAGLFIPVSREPIGAPVLAFGSGTTGLGNHCAPSLEQPEIVRLGWYRENMVAYAARGVITVFPDYTGFNTPAIPQRYFSKYAEGYLLLDSLRAARSVARSGPVMFRSRTVALPQSFTAGYSQGGHAALAAADLWRRYAPELTLTGAIGFGSTNSVETLMREAGYYPPSIIHSYLSIYGPDLVRPQEIFQPRWLPTLEYDVMSQCVPQFQRYYPYDVRDLYTERFYAAIMGRRLAEEFPDIARILDENESGLSGHGVPVLMVHGAADVIVSTAAQREYVARLRATGVEVTLLELDGVLHRETRPSGFAASLEFIDRLLGR